MKFKASAILSLYTGRIYSSITPTVLFGPIFEHVLGVHAVYSHELPELKHKYGDAILNQCPPEFQSAARNWQHTDNWREKVALIDEAYGEIELKQI